MYYGFLSLLIAVSFVDIFFHRGFGVAPMALLFVVLKLQADRAADILIRSGLSRPVSDREEPEMESWIPPADKDPFASPFRERLRLVGPDNSEPKAEARKEAKKEAPKPAKPAEPKKKAPYREPKFHGAPHEILGVGPEAHTRSIVKAFRHWIKEFHPDHIKPGQEMQRATDRARKLTAARQTLLEQRRHRRNAA